ncbi:type 1 glutamine amidotransferase domain-containing protein [Acidaminobacter sp.]|uniref:type 1 glutamine amidotransferase domain-containing protein n=1 Tax=Acidaminobacter sp. TaxID=1872102 RepID=UPI0013809079|nr:type 1 glutamine amidotransferase domain-containing protein [Acidaminobacter sp.]MDK9710178.1 type 1 glutamine amidotransferase [Acidaminobacter sp.]MZQ98736.1 DJ-1/PfpI/YhbO family deglycase/protease [Acidaminobacter sp.]
MGRDKILILTDDYAEDLELLYPYYRMIEAGYNVVMASDAGGRGLKGKNGVPYKSDVSWDDISGSEFVGLLIPGGWAPDKLRRNDKVKAIVREMNEDGKPIGIICHAGWVTISAGIMKGRTATSTPAIRDDMENAGCKWVNEEVVVDGNLISSRAPMDLPAYMKAFIQVLEG